MSGKRDLTREEADRVIAGIRRIVVLHDGKRRRAARTLGLSAQAIIAYEKGVNWPSFDTACRVAELEGRSIQDYVDAFRVDDMDPRWPSKGRAIVALRALMVPEHTVRLVLDEDPDFDEDPGTEYWFERGLHLSRLPRGAPNPTVVPFQRLNGPDRPSSRPPPDEPGGRGASGGG